MLSNVMNNNLEKLKKTIEIKNKLLLESLTNITETKKTFVKFKKSLKEINNVEFK